ncbi:uncharacterized protein LOC142431800 [Tenrec ecaudatus]|uniref:uncharacterized protein LOC142431800 n=1 Tax=Tenrec ecaudatus TaxID=94439 RepID=UPI003F59051F
MVAGKGVQRPPMRPSSRAADADGAGLRSYTSFRTVLHLFSHSPRVPPPRVSITREPRPRGYPTGEFSQPARSTPGALSPLAEPRRRAGQEGWMEAGGRALPPRRHDVSCPGARPGRTNGGGGYGGPMGGNVSCGGRPPQPPLGPEARGRPETVRDGPRAPAGEATPPSLRPDAPSVEPVSERHRRPPEFWAAPEGRARLPPGSRPRRLRRRLPECSDRAAGGRGRGLHGQCPRPAVQPPRSRAALGARVYPALFWDTSPLDVIDRPQQLDFSAMESPPLQGDLRWPTNWLWVSTLYFPLHSLCDRIMEVCTQ